MTPRPARKTARERTLIPRARPSQVSTKGDTIAFRKSKFAKPEALAAYLVKHKANVKLQPDHKVLFRGNWEAADARLAAVRQIAADLAGLMG